MTGCRMIQASVTKPIPDDTPPPPPGQVLYLLGALTAGGAERAAVDLGIAMKRRGAEIRFVCTASHRDAVGDYWRSLLEREKVPVTTTPHQRLNLRTAKWLAGIVSDPSVSLVHAHVEYAVAALGLSRLMHKHRAGVLQKIPNMQPPAQWMIRFLMRRAKIRTSVAGGRSTYEAVKDRLPGVVHCVPNGMNFHWPIYDPARLDQRQAELGLDPNRRHVLHVGRMSGDSPSSAQKAHDTLIRAWRSIDAGGLGMDLHLIGGGNLRGALEAMAGGDASIRFHGIVPGVERWLLATDAFVLPSRWEGLPNAGIEAAGTGIPCIFADIPPCRELDAARCAYHAVDDEAALAALLREVASEAYHRPVDRAAIEATRQRYGISETLTAYLEIYDQMLNRGHNSET